MSAYFINSPVSFNRSISINSNMLVKLLQVSLILFVIECTFLEKNNVQYKRSPLAIGLIGFDKHSPHIYKVHGKGKNGNNTTLFAQGAHEEEKVKENIKQEWIPGRVHHHAYIPAHVHHIYIPAHSVLIARTIETVIVPHSKLEVFENPHRKHYGGFGVGVDFNGQGAGHGFYVSF